MDDVLTFQVIGTESPMTSHHSDLCVLLGLAHVRQ